MLMFLNLSIEPLKIVIWRIFFKYVNYLSVVLVGWRGSGLGGALLVNFSFLLLLLWDAWNPQWKEFHFVQGLEAL